MTIQPATTEADERTFREILTARCTPPVRLTSEQSLALLETVAALRSRCSLAEDFCRILILSIRHRIGRQCDRMIEPIESFLASAIVPVPPPAQPAIVVDTEIAAEVDASAASSDPPARMARALDWLLQHHALACAADRCKCKDRLHAPLLPWREAQEIVEEPRRYSV